MASHYPESSVLVSIVATSAKFGSISCVIDGLLSCLSGISTGQARIGSDLAIYADSLGRGDIVTKLLLRL